MVDFRTNNYSEGEILSFLKSTALFCHIGWIKLTRTFGSSSECLQREELSFRQQLGKINCGMEKQINDTGWSIRTEIKILTERHARKQISLLGFIHGLSMLVASKAATAL